MEILTKVLVLLAAALLIARGAQAEDTKVLGPADAKLGPPFVHCPLV
jgi:hypothetical protein